MKVYKLEADGEGNWVGFFAAKGIVLPLPPEYQSFFAAQPRIRIVRNNEFKIKGVKQKLADFSNLGSSQYPCFGQRSKDLLGPRLEGLVQWLPLECDEAPYWLFNVTNVVDALDEEKSILKRFDDGRVMRIAEFAFRSDRLQGQLLFRPKQDAVNLVTQDFVDLVHQHQLTGFMFRLVWSSENGPVSCKLKDYERPRFTGLEPR